MKLHRIRLAAVLLCFAVLTACATNAVRRTDLYQSYYDDPVRGVGAELRYELVGDTHVLHLSGSSYDMGFEYGRKAAELGVRGMYDEVFANAAGMLADEVPAGYEKHVNVRLVKQLLLDGWGLLEPYVPRYIMDMLEGFAVGSGLSPDDVYAMHALPDFTETSCSALWATGSATTTGESVQIRVLDYIMGLGIQKYPAVVFMDFERGHHVANIGWLGLVGVISGMNDTGLAVSEMGYGNPVGENLHGMPMPFLLLDILRWADDPEQAEGIIRSAARTNSYAYIVGTDERSGLAFVTDAYEVGTFHPGATDAPVLQLVDSLHAGHYQDRMDKLVAESHGRISPGWLMQEFIPAIAMDSNLQCVVYDLSHGRFYVANAPDLRQRACDQPYTEFAFPGVE